MKYPLMFAGLAGMAAVCACHPAAAESPYDGLIAAHAQANGVPETLVHRIIQRESRYRADIVGHCGCIGLMQIKLATARALGYTGDAAGLRDPNTNLTYGVKYLAGAYRAANGNEGRAIHYYANGYYGVAKGKAGPTTPSSQMLDRRGPTPALQGSVNLR